MHLKFPNSLHPGNSPMLPDSSTALFFTYSNTCAKPCPLCSFYTEFQTPRDARRCFSVHKCQSCAPTSVSSFPECTRLSLGIRVSYDNKSLFMIINPGLALHDKQAFSLLWGSCWRQGVPFPGPGKGTGGQWDRTAPAVPLTSMVALATGEPENTNTHRYSPDSSARAFRILQHKGHSRAASHPNLHCSTPN